MKRPKLTINTKQFIEGECFICHEKIIEHPDAYAHFACAIAYEDEKEKRIKEAQAKERKEKYAFDENDNLVLINGGKE